MAIEVCEYDPEWPIRAAAVISELHATCAGEFRVVEHLGSTSVPGLAAKPVIDVMAGVDVVDPARFDALLDPPGWRRVETGMPGRLLYRRDGVHLHLVPADGFGERNEVLLRDHLRTHPADAARYGDLKRSLAAQDVDGDAYTRGKTDLIQELTDRARAARGLSPVPVWEE